MLKGNFISEWAAPTLWVSAAYLFSFFITFSIVMPLQDAVFPAFGNYASLLFLPHGVRVISAWLYGWRSLVLLAPGAILTHSYLYGSDGFSIDYMIAVFFGVFCAAFSFWFLALAGLELRFQQAARIYWRDVMLAGAGASILNSFGTAVFFGNDAFTASARFFGDLTGMITSTFILMITFRTLRRRGR